MSDFPRRRGSSKGTPRAPAARAWPWIAVGIVAIAGGAGSGCGGPEAPPAASKPRAPLSMEDEEALATLRARHAQVLRKIEAYESQVKALRQKLAERKLAIEATGGRRLTQDADMIAWARSIVLLEDNLGHATKRRDDLAQKMRDIEENRDAARFKKELEALSAPEDDPAETRAMEARIELGEDQLGALARDQAAQSVIENLGRLELPKGVSLQPRIQRALEGAISTAVELERNGKFDEARAAYSKAIEGQEELPEEVIRAFRGRMSEVSGAKARVEEARAVKRAEDEEDELAKLVEDASVNSAAWAEVVDKARTILTDIDSRRQYAVFVLRQALTSSTAASVALTRESAREALTWRGRPTGSRASAMAAAAEVREACARLDLKGATAALGVVAKANPDWPPLAGLQSLVAALRTDTAEVETMVEELRAPRASVEDLRVAADKAGRWLVRRPEWSVRLAPAVGEAMRRIDADAAARKAEGERWALRARAARDAGDAEPLLAEYDSLSDAAREATRKERDRLVSLVAEAKRKAEADAAAAVAAEERRRAQEEARARAEEKRKADAKAAVETKLRQADEQRRKGDDTHRKTADRIAAFKRAVDLYEDVKGNESAEREARAQACFWCALLNKRLFDAYDGARPRSPIYYEAAKAHRASAIRHRDDLERLYPDVVDATGRETYAAALRRLFAE